MSRCAALTVMSAVVAVALAPVPGQAQTPTMPATLRYGSGLLDVPVSSVLPSRNILVNYSGFFSSIGRRVMVDGAGQPAGFGPARSSFHGDASAAIGLFDRLETGITLQSFGDDTEGGNLWGLFGRLRLWEPIDQGLGFAVGGRYLTNPDYGDGVERAPGRLGFPDERLRRRYTGVRGLDTDLSLYAVTTAYLRGYDGGFLPENDLTLTLGWGGGMFGQGGELDFYAPEGAGGWFAGTSVHLDAGDDAVVTVMAEHNGFDVNVGARYDWAGLRVGAHWLALNHDWPTDGQYSEYHRPKFGFSLSAALCPSAPGFRCRPRRMRRVEPDTIFMPAPPPDTVVVAAAGGPVIPQGAEPASVCLSTGQNVPIQLTATGDTLVGERAIPIGALRPAMVFAGSYAGNAFWYLDDEVIVFEGGDFGKSDDVFPIDCDQILRVGVHEGVPVFAVLSARRPLEVIFIPVRPGLWQRYERGLRRSPESRPEGPDRD